MGTGSFLPSLLLLLLSVHTALQQSNCVKELEEDVCPQREGVDIECQAKCEQIYGTASKSLCQLRDTSTLLSFFGIRSFICRCFLPATLCRSGLVLSPFSLDSLQLHSTLSPLPSSPLCPTPISSLHCSGDFHACGWLRSSSARWFSASAFAPAPFTPPEGEYLVGSPLLQASAPLLLTTCSLCSVDAVNVSARLWRPPGVDVQLCFRESDETLCAPIRTTNGNLINEVLPHSRHFQIVYKFSNINAGDTVLVDDLSLSFSPCTQELDSPMERRIEPTLAAMPRIGMGNDRCYGDDCLPRKVRMCEGREGLLACRAKCSDQQDNGSGARCIRRSDTQRMQRMCVCQLRRKMPKAPKVYKAEFAEERNEKTQIQKKDKNCLLQCSHSSCSCVPTVCTASLCNFEMGKECGWADMRLLSNSFNNVSVAEKNENRYGLVRLPSFGYAGLVRRTRVDGPIRLSIDLFPSAQIQVRICVHSLHRCQSHTVSERAWNRLTARIRVRTAHKIFIIFYNPSSQHKILAMDNIATDGGTCSFL